MKKLRLKISLILIVFAVPVTAFAGPAETNAVETIKEELQTNINIVWTCIAAFLVFFMQAGFAVVEAGFTRAKNAVNILMKNLMDFSVGTLTFFLIGFGLMFGKTNGLFGTTLFALGGVEPGADWNWTFLIFQTVFAATAATIVSGAMAERTKFVGYLMHSFFITLFIYPVFGSWAWGGAFRRWRLAREPRFSRLCRLDGRALDRRLAGAGRSDHARSAYRQIRSRRPAESHPRT